MDQLFDFAATWQRVGLQRRTILSLVVAATVLTAVVAFLLPPWYRAQASLLPPTEEETGLSLASLFKGVGVPGVRVPTQAAPADVFLAVLGSRRVNGEIVRRFGLLQLYRKRLVEDALRELRDHTRFDLTDAGVIVISVEDRSPKRAADMANAYVELLDRFNREVRMTKGHRMRLFVTRRLAETREQLGRAEQTLADYQAKNRAVALSPQMSSAVETAARLYAERVALLVRLGVVRSYTRGATDEETRLAQQIAELDRQLRQLPETGLELARLVREVKTLEQVYVLLSAQFEEAQIEEARDVATVEILDVATPPERKAHPHRLIMVGAAFLLSLSAGVAYALMAAPPRPEPRDTAA